MKFYQQGYAYFFFLIPFLVLLIIYVSASQVLQQVVDIRRRSLLVVADWYRFYQLTDQRFQFLDQSPVEDTRAWQQALADFERSLQALSGTSHRWMLSAQTNQEIDASVNVWQITRENIAESDDLYSQIADTLVGQVLLENSLASLAESALTGADLGMFPSGALWQFYQLQDRLTDLDVTSTVFTGYLERVQQAVEQRVNFLNWLIYAAAMLLSGGVILISSRLFIITSQERELYVTEIEAKNRALAGEVMERRQAEENLRQTLHSIGDAVIITDANGRVENMNLVAEQLTGWTLTEVRGRPLVDFFNIVNSHNRQPAENPVERVLQDGHVVGLANHTALIGRDGTERQIADSAAPICSPDGRLAGVVMVFRDVTEAYTMQHVLSESENRYRQLFELESDAIFLVDNQTNTIIEANTAATELYGFSRDELLQMKNTHLSAEPEETQRVTQSEPIGKEHVVYIPLRHHRKSDGTVFPVEITGRFFERDGRSVHIAAIRDISQRIEAQAELKAREAKLSSIFRVAPVGIGMVVARVFTEVNDSLCSMTGYTRDELLGQNARLLYPTQEDYDFVGQSKYEQIRQQGTGTVETCWLRKDGRILSILLSSTPVNPEDWTQGVTFTALNITHRKETEREIHEKTVELDRFFTAALDLLCIADIDGCFRRLNPQWEQTLGYTLDELIGCRFLEFVHPEDLADTLAATQNLADGEDIINFVNRYRHKDGTYRWIEWRSFPAGNLIYAAARDITERKQFEQELQALNQRLERELRFNEALLAAIPTPVFFKDNQGRYLGCNIAFTETMGQTADDLRGKTVFDLWPAELAEIYHQADMDLLANPHHQAYEAQVVRKDGQRRDVYFAKDVFSDENGNPAGIVGAYMDITEREQAHAALRASREAEKHFSERLTHLVAAITELSTVPDFDSLCRRVIELGVRQLGFERLGLWFFVPDALEMTGSFGIDEHGSLRDERGIRVRTRPGDLHEQLRRSNQPNLLMEGGEIYDERANQIASGERMFCGLWDGEKALGTLSADNLLTLRAFTTQDKEILGIFSAALGHLCSLKLAQAELHQLTIELEQRVQERTSQLEEANKELEAFSYSVSHDLRSPLRSVDGFSRLLVEEYADQLNDEARSYLERVRAAAQNMGQLIDDLLNLSRLARIHMSRTQVNLSELVGIIVEDLCESQPTRVVEWIIASDQIASADFNLIRIVLDNLLRNAWKFTSKQDLVCIEFGSSVQDGKTVYYVRDNGAGFDMAYADKLFRAFQRLHSPGEFEGTGIGLTIVHRIIARHGGRVWAEGVVDQGATFYFTLA